METDNCVTSLPSNGKPECCGNEVENIVSETVCLEANSKMMLEDIYTKCAMKERELKCILEKIQKIENDLSDGMKEEEKTLMSKLTHWKIYYKGIPNQIELKS